MSEAFSSTLHLSFEVRGGLLMRQIHHWAALIFMAVDRHAHDAHLLHGRVPQAARGQLGRRLPAADPRPGRRLLGLLAPGRRPVGQRPAHHRRRRAVDPDHRQLHVVLHLRRRVPRPGADPAPVHRAHPAGAGHHPRADRPAPVLRGAAQAHAVPGLGPDEQERRRLPALPDLRGEGRRLLLHGVRRHRADGGDDDDQPGVELRPVRPLTGVGRRAARLVHAVPRGIAAPHARVRRGRDRALDAVAQRDHPGHGRAGHPVHRCSPRTRSSRPR